MSRKLTEEWVEVFDNFIANENSIDDFTVKDIHPVFVWKSQPECKTKLCSIVKSPVNFIAEVTLTGDDFNKQYQFKLNSINHKKNFRTVIEALQKVEGDSWIDKWNEAIKNKFLIGTKKTSPGITFDEYKLTQSTVNEQTIQIVNTQPILEKRKYGPTQIGIQTKKFKSNDNSKLIRINRITKETISVPLLEGQGICINDEGNICVLDIGNGIQIYNENLECIKKISFNLPQGIGLSFYQKQFYITCPLKNSVILLNNTGTPTKKTFANPISVRVYYGRTYILCGNSFICDLQSLSESVPAELIERNYLGVNVTFSDFDIIDNFAFILDSNGIIHRYDFLSGEITQQTIEDYKVSENPSGICRLNSDNNNQIFIAESENCKISSFIIEDNYMEKLAKEYLMQNYEPIKIVSNKKHVFATAIKETTFPQQAAEQPNFGICTDDTFDQLFNFNPQNSPLKYCSNSNFLINTDEEIYNACTKVRELEKVLRFILSSGILLIQFINLQQEHIDDINTVMEQLEKFREVVYKVGETQKENKKFIQNWFHVFRVLTLLINFKYLHSNYDSHLLMKMEKSNSTNERSEVLNNDKYGSIVFVDSDQKFSFQKTKKSISFGIICGSEKENKFPISIFGNNLVRVFVPKAYQRVDERGMFVIIPNEENIGVGEIISFTDMCTRESSSYYIVGITTLDLSSNTPSLYLYSLSEEENMERIHFPIEDGNKKDKNENKDQENEICFVSMISFPMSNSLLDLFIPTLQIKTIENTKPGECSLHSDTDTNTLRFYFKMHETINKKPRHVYHLYVLLFNK